MALSKVALFRARGKSCECKHSFSFFYRLRA